ncbi:MAG: NUDIX hydrolase [Gemmatimonadales bacterium]
MPDAASRPWAAVAVVLAARPDPVLLIRRAEREGDVWSGHLAFPGGRAAPGELDLLETARREAREEVGLDLSGVAPIGQLDDLATRTPILPSLSIRPFVFAIPNPQPLTPNREVAAAHWVPLESFFRPGVRGTIEYPRYGTLARAPAYHLDIGALWGITQRILTPLLELVR